MLISCENIIHKYKNSRTVNYVLDDISLDIEENEIVGIMGPSGSGKSTFGQIIAGLLKQSSGEIYYKDKPILYPFNSEARRDIQILFQHPEQSFNPRMTLESSMREVYKIHNIEYSKEEMLKMLENFGLFKGHLERYPHQLSGGELQRFALARVLVLEPKLIVLDEPTSMLDAISQAQMIRLLQNIRQERKISYVFISHDRFLSQFFCDRLYEISSGKLKMLKEKKA